MKTVNPITNKKLPKIKVNKDLNKYNDVVLFPKKVEKMERLLRGVKLPEVPQ